MNCAGCDREVPRLTSPCSGRVVAFEPQVGVTSLRWHTLEASSHVSDSHACSKVEALRDLVRCVVYSSRGEIAHPDGRFGPGMCR